MRGQQGQHGQGHHGMMGHHYANNPRMNDPAVQRELQKEVVVMEEQNRLVASSRGCW